MVAGSVEGKLVGSVEGKLVNVEKVLLVDSVEEVINGSGEAMLVSSEMLALDASEKDVLVGSVVGGISVEVAGDVVLAGGVVDVAVELVSGSVPGPVLALVVVVVHWQGGGGVLSQPQLLIGVVEPTSEEESLPIPHSFSFSCMFREFDEKSLFWGVSQNYYISLQMIREALKSGRI